MNTLTIPDLTHHPGSWMALAVFIVAYLFVLAEEFIHLRKSKPVVLAAGFIWMLVAWVWQATGREGVEELVRHNLLEFAELLLFLLVAMTFVNSMQERHVFDVLRVKLTARRLSYRQVYWITGALAFLLSPLIDNLTTALVLGAVALSVGAGVPRFVVVTCISIVVAANAGGAFSPFGDVTTLMVWQAGHVSFTEFMPLVVPAIVNWLVPAMIMSFSVPVSRPKSEAASCELKTGAIPIIALFAATITLTVSLHQWLHLPPFLGMMTGFGALAIYGYWIRRVEQRQLAAPVLARDAPPGFKPATKPFDIFISVKRAEWDTLLFFYGVILSIGGLAAVGYLTVLSTASYQALGDTTTNVLVGIASSVVDNIPVMFAVLTIEPQLSTGQWLLVTLTAGVGGSMLSIGSAAGVALMGQARGIYTFFAHLRWSWAIALGYAASIWAHIALNADLL